jgi:hypothetical protein
MSLTLIESPACEPVELIAAKTFLKVEYDNDHEDLLLASLIKVARKAIEAYSGRVMISQVWEFTINAGFAGSSSDSTYMDGSHSRGKGGILLPRSPFIELVNDPFLVDDYGSRKIQDYRLDEYGREAHIHFGKSLATFLDGKGKIKITFRCGYGATPQEVPEPFRHAILLMVSQLYEHRVEANDNFKTPPLLTRAAMELVKPYRTLRLL